RYNKQVWMLSDAAARKLKAYDYPGNVRELENIIEQAVSMADDEHVLTERHLFMPESGGASPENVIPYDRNLPLDKYLSSVEKQIIADEMLRARGNISKAAEALSLKRQTLQHKLKKYDIR
ncbi:MAG: transcriptional regulator, partial [Firmicutes bacterium]|nr:transcriptional regulator [Bacillota bacterium]